MSLTRRQKYDYTDIDRGELRLIRVGHALWAMLKRDRAKYRGLPVQEPYPWQDLDDALECVFEVKRQELKQKRAARSQEIAARLRKGKGE